MKTIGLLGGTSYPSTVLYYQRLNQLVQQQLGGYHSASLILYNIDYHHIKSRYHERWQEIPLLLKKELEKLLSLQPDAIMICNNTLHKAFDLIREELQLDIPVFHIIELTLAYLRARRWKKVMLLGTRFTMEDAFFKSPLQAAGIEVSIPDTQERAEIQQIQSRLASGEMEASFASYFQSLCDKYQDQQAFILACTELPLVFSALHNPPKLVNTIELQCQAAVDFQLS